jgi:hypothetical protein
MQLEDDIWGPHTGIIIGLLGCDNPFYPEDRGSSFLQNKDFITCHHIPKDHNLGSLFVGPQWINIFLSSTSNDTATSEVTTLHSATMCCQQCQVEQEKKILMWTKPKTDSMNISMYMTLHQVPSPTIKIKHTRLLST